MESTVCRKEYKTVVDSGKRRKFKTGSVRDVRTGKGRYDLIPGYPLYRLARHYENGCKKYGDRNWEKGQPVMGYLDSAMRHLSKLIMGMDDEDHAAACVWNVFAYMYTVRMIDLGKLPRELDDRPEPIKQF